MVIGTAKLQSKQVSASSLHRPARPLGKWTRLLLLRVQSKRQFCKQNRCPPPRPYPQIQGDHTSCPCPPVLETFQNKEEMHLPTTLRACLPLAVDESQTPLQIPSTHAVLGGLQPDGTAGPSLSRQPRPPRRQKQKARLSPRSYEHTSPTGRAHITHRYAPQQGLGCKQEGRAPESASAAREARRTQNTRGCRQRARHGPQASHVLRPHARI